MFSKIDLFDRLFALPPSCAAVIRHFSVHYTDVGDEGIDLYSGIR